MQINTMYNYLKLTVSILLVGSTMLFTSCSDSSTGLEEGDNLETGFVLNVQTPAETNLVKYFDQMPSGTVDMSDGTDFQRFFAIDAYDGALYMARVDGAAGFSKIVVNDAGEVVEEGIIPTVDEGSFRIKIKDANTGIFQDRNTPNLISVFDPTDLTITGTIDMSAGFSPAPQRYQSFFFRDDLVFAPIRGEQGEVFDSTIVHIADLSTGEYVGMTSLDSGPATPESGFGQRAVDEFGNIYVADAGNPTGNNPFSSILKIPAGSNEFDPGYDFMPALVANPSNTFFAPTGGFYYYQNNKAYALVATETPQALIDLIQSVGGNPANLSQEQIQQALTILFTAENARWSELDMQAQTVTPIEGIPSVSPFITDLIMEYNGKLYFPVTTPDVNALYELDPSTGQASKAFDVTGGALIGMYNLAQDN